MFDYLPPTLIIPLDPQGFNQSIKALKELVEYIEQKNIENGQIRQLKSPALVAPKDDSIQILQDKSNKSLANYFQNPYCSAVKFIKDEFNAGENMWILKPTGLNRGNGIEVRKGWEQVKAWLKEQLKISSSVRESSESELTLRGECRLGGQKKRKAPPGGGPEVS